MYEYVLESAFYCLHVPLRKLVKAIDRPRPIEKVRPGIETNSLSGPSALDGNARFVVSRTHT